MKKKQKDAGVGLRGVRTYQGKMPRKEGNIPVWSVEVLESGGYVQYHLRLSAEVAKWLTERLSVLLSDKAIRGYQVRLVDQLVVPAFHFYERYGLDG